jgi:hypothetical protein
MVIRTAASIAGGFVPGPESPAEKQYFWRLRIGVAVCILFFGMVVFAAASLGAVPAIFPGFARNDAVQSLAETTLSQQLLQLRTAQCKATTSEARQLYFRLMTEALTQYMALTGKSWSVPPCDALL